MARALLVVLYGQVIGQINQSFTSADPVFTYADGATRPLSLALPVAAGVHRGKALDAFLANLLPEAPEARERWAQQLGVPADDVVGLLSQMGWDLPGAVQFAEPDRLAELQDRSGEHRPLSDDEIEQHLRALRTGSDASWTLPQEHWSLAGQQAKLAVARLEDRWHSAEGSAATTHIVKPGIVRLMHQALVEHATMAAARAVGVEVAGSEFRYFGEEPAIVIERFDRLVEGRDVIRFHQEDLASATGTMPGRKYEENGGPGLARMARVVREHSTSQDADRWRLLDFAAINYIAGAPDGHAKNISLLLYPDGVEIAPLYDLATGFPYLDSPNQALRSVAVSIGGRRKFEQVLGKHWDRAARALALDPVHVRGRVRDLASGFPEALRDALARVEHPAAADIWSRTADRLAHHLNHLVARLDDPAELRR